MKNIVILGSTGSIGTSSLSAISHLGEDYRVIGLTANNNVDLFLKQVHESAAPTASSVPPTEPSHVFLGLTSTFSFVRPSKRPVK